MRPAYLFAGPEDFLADLGTQAVLNRMMSPEERDAGGLAVVYGGEADSLPDLLAVGSLFGPARRAVVVRRAEDLKERPLDALLKYLEQPAPDLCVILIAAKLDRRRADFKRLAQLCSEVECAHLKPAAMAKWAADYLMQLGKRLDPDAAEQMAAVNWPSLRELAAELDRLALLTGDEPMIKPSDIEEAGGSAFAMERWRLSDAVGSGDAAAAFRIADNLRKWNVEPVQIIWDLSKLYERLWVIDALLRRRQLNLAQESLGLAPFLVSRYAGFARRLGSAGIAAGLLRLEAADRRLKGGRTRPEVELEMLLADLTSPETSPRQ